MRFNPIKRILYTDKGEIIRKLDCPYKVAFSETTHIADSEHVCDICNGEIVDTNGFEEEALVQLGKKMNLCFKVDTSQANLKLVYF